MRRHDFYDLLKGNPYPGRGILLGVGHNGERLALYFIMGRSENSRNRVFVPEGDAFRIEPFDVQKIEDPSLILYRPMRTHAGSVVLTNGDQTDTVLEALHAGGTFEGGLRTRRFEPDAPHFTPRISGIQQLATGDYALSILKAADKDGTSCQRFFYEYEARPGMGHFIHTYQGDGNPLPSFAGEPVAVSLPEDLNDFAQGAWRSLNEQNRVALFARAANHEGKVLTLHVFNRHVKETI